MFFYYWAFERAGAPQGFKIAAVKTIEHIKKDKSATPSDIFKMYFHGKLNIKNNPLLDTNIQKFDIIPVINEIKKGKLYNAFNMINLNGINHKIKSFFIRDIFYLIGDEIKFRKIRRFRSLSFSRFNIQKFTLSFRAPYKRRPLF